MSVATPGAAPAPSGDRLGELDALRGFALFGVFAANLIGFAVYVLSTSADLEALATRPLDDAASFVLQWLIHDKANTLFAFLFGLGFYLQMTRLQGRGVDFNRIYLRRLTILFLIGLAHFIFVWNWDILHLYALAGFALYFMRGISDRALLIGGVLLAAFARVLVLQGLELSGYNERAGIDAYYADNSVLARQAIARGGDYLAAVAGFAEFARVDWIQNGMLLAWFFYALGRFMLGAWVGRRGWLENAGARLPAFRRWMMILLPAGLAGEFASAAALKAVTGNDALAAYTPFAETLHFLTAPVLAAGYVCMVIVGLHAARTAPFFRLFAPVGRMALTNYVMQSVMIGFVLFGVGPGLALAGRIGAFWLSCIVVIGFAAQILLSAAWLRYFAYGPLEWLWRALTYGAAPPLRRRPARPPAAAPGAA